MTKNSHVLTSFVILCLASFTVISQDTGSLNEKLFHSVNKIPGQYIVVMKSEGDPASITNDLAESSVKELASDYGLPTEKIYTAAFTGFSAVMTEDAAEVLSRDERVLFVEEDAYVSATAVQSNPTWGLDRIDQHAYPFNNSYEYTATGEGVHAYVIDSGIRMTHTDFGGRASTGTDLVGDGQNGNDCFGHGTHVAGTIGSATYGVAKSVSLHAVRVLGCDGNGSVSMLLSGVNWVTANRTNPAVANISIILSGPSNALDNAIKNSITSGVTYTIAAGNFGMDACLYSPARIPQAITVGSTVYNGNQDYQMGYSNFGPCLDLFAPGNGIVSLSNADDSSFRSMNGTSMASPHVAGTAALYLQRHPDATPLEVSDAIKDGATTGTIMNVEATSPNKVLYSMVDGAEPPVAAAVSGRVLDGNGEGMGGVKVKITYASSTVRSTSTDSLGNFAFSQIPTGMTYTVTVTARKYTFTPENRSFHLMGDLHDVSFTTAN